MNTRVSQLYGVGTDVEVKRINLQIVMQLQKRNDGLSLRNLLSILRAEDKTGSGCLDFDAFEAGLRKYNVFPTVVEIQALMKYHNKSSRDEPANRLVDYEAFVKMMRLPLKDRRLDITKEAFCKITGEPEAQCCTVAQAKEAFAYEEFDKWCAAIEVAHADGEIITWEQFCDFYADISLVIFDDNRFIKLVEDSWKVAEQPFKQVSQRDLETLMAQIRQALLKAGTERHTEEFVLREVFRQFDRDNNGVLSQVELHAMLQKINLNVDQKYLEALIKRLDTNKNGVIEFEELVQFVVQERYHKY